MARFKFPRQPLAQHDNPFQDESGKNPFSDESPVEALPDVPAAADNVYAPAAGPSTGPSPPVHYEAMLPNRSRSVLFCGATGAVLAALGVLGVLLGLTGSGTLRSALFFCLPLHLFGLTAALPAWIRGAADLRAIKAGAMDASGRRNTRIGLVLGIGAAVAAVVPLTLFVVIVVASLFE